MESNARIERMLRELDREPPLRFFSWLLGLDRPVEARPEPRDQRFQGAVVSRSMA